MRVLLFGGSGRIGALLGRELTEMGHEVLAPVREDFDLARKDFKNSSAFNSNVHVIVNAAGVTDRNKAERSKLLVEKVNVEAVRQLAAFCGESGVPFVHLSSGDLYAWGDKAARESDLTFSRNNAYEKSKYDAEFRIIQNMESNYWIFRLGHVWSKLDLDRISSLSCPEILVENRVISPISRTFCAYLLARAIDRVTDPCSESGIYNLSCRGVTTLLGFLRIFDSVRKGQTVYSTTLEPSLLKPAVFPGSGLAVEKFEREFLVRLPYWESEFWEDSIATIKRRK